MHLCILTSDVTPEEYILNSDVATYSCNPELRSHHHLLIIRNSDVTAYIGTNWTLTLKHAFVYHINLTSPVSLTHLALWPQNLFYTELWRQTCTCTSWTLMSPPTSPCMLYPACSEGSPSLTLSYSSKINGYLYHQRVSPPLKKPAALPVGCDGPLQIVMAVWRPFCLNFNFLGRMWQPSRDNNGAPNGHYNLQRAVTPDEITHHKSLQKKCPNGSKGTLRPDLQANTRPRIFLKKTMSPQDTGRQL
jgi:hypothetical protein